MFLIDDSKDADTDEFHNQHNHGQQQSRQQQQQQKSATQDECNRALNDIQNAQTKQVVDQAYNYFVGTQFEGQITNACQAKCDQMGWK